MLKPSVETHDVDGLLVAEFSEQQMVGERDGDLLQQSQLREK